MQKPHSTLTSLWLLLHHELLLSYRSLADTLQPLWFFLLIISLFPLAISSNLTFLSKIAPGVVWITVLLAILLSVDKLFILDHLDGSLEQMLISRYPLSMIIVIKCCAHWLISAVPIILFTPLIALFMQINLHTLFILMLTLLLGTPTLILIAAVGSAVTVGLRHRGVLLALLVLPLLIPILIFGAGSVRLASQYINVDGQLALLAALFLFALTFAPWVIAAALRISYE